MIFVSFSKAVIKQSISTNIVAFVATVADHKTAGDDLQRFFAGAKSGSQNRKQKKKTPGRSGSCRWADLNARPVNLWR